MRPAKIYIISVEFDDERVIEIRVKKSLIEPVLKSLPYREIATISVEDLKEDNGIE